MKKLDCMAFPTKRSFRIFGKHSVTPSNRFIFLNVEINHYRSPKGMLEKHILNTKQYIKIHNADIEDRRNELNALAREISEETEKIAELEATLGLDQNPYLFSLSQQK